MSSSQLNVTEVSIERIRAIPQVRREFDEAALLGLAASIKSVGIQQPIRVRADGEGTYLITDGERRWRAAKLAGLTHVPILLDAGSLTPADITLRQLVANCQRADLTPLETAHAIQRLMQESGWSAGEAAGKLGMAAGTVSRFLRLLDLPDAIQAQVQAGRIPASAAYELAQITDRAEQSRLAGDVAAGRLTRDGLTAMRKRASAASKPTDGLALSRVSAALGGGRTVTVAGPALSMEEFIVWLEELLAKARKARPQGLELSTFIKMLRDQARGDAA